MISRDIKTTYTKPQLKVHEWCCELGLACEMEKSISKYYLDVYLPELQLGIELDGVTHSKKRDARRDGFIKRVYNIDIWRYKNEKINKEELN